MRHAKSMAGVICLTAFVGALLLAGCSESKNRRAGTKLLEAVKRAQQGSSKAMALMANPYYRDMHTQQALPKLQPFKPGQAAPSLNGDVNAIELRPLGEVNPEALAVLKQAEKDMSDAINSVTEADPNDHGLAVDRALAAAALANVQSLKAEYHWNLLLNAWSRIDAELRVIRRNVLEARQQHELVSLYDALIKPGTVDLGKLRTDTSAQLQALSGEMKKTQGDIDSLTGKKTILQKQLGEDQAAAGNLQTEAEADPTAKDAKEKLAQAQKSREAAAQELLDLQKLENDLERLNQELSLQSLKNDHLKGSLEVFTKAMNNQEKAVGEAQTAQQAARTSLAALQKKITDSVDKLTKGGLVKAAQDDYAQSLEQYEKGALVQINNAAGFDRTAQNLAEQGALNMSMANLNLQMGELSSEVTSVMSWAQEQFKAIAGTELAEVKLDKPETYHAKAVTRLKEAASSYHRAAGIADSKVRWVYQASEGAAYLTLARIAPEEPDALTSATQLIADARRNKESSPNLQHVNDLAALLQAPTSEPAVETPSSGPGASSQTGTSPASAPTP